MDIGTVRGLITVILLVLFLGIVFWSFSRRRRKDFDRAAQLPLEDDRKASSADDTHSEERREQDK